MPAACAGGLAYFAWRTKCCGGVWCKAAACCARGCAGGARTRDNADEEDSKAEEGEAGAQQAKRPKKQRMARPEGNEDDLPEPPAAEGGGDADSPAGSPRAATLKKAAKKGRRAKKHLAGH